MATLNENNYWPGLVDALVNVLLNLLFIVALMAMAIGTLGLQIASHPEEAALLAAASSSGRILFATGSEATASTRNFDKARDSAGRPAGEVATSPTGTPAVPSSSATAAAAPLASAPQPPQPLASALLPSASLASAPLPPQPSASALLPPAPLASAPLTTAPLLSAPLSSPALPPAPAATASAAAGLASATAPLIAESARSVVPSGSPDAASARAGGQTSRSPRAAGERGAQEIRIALGSGPARDELDGLVAISAGRVSDPALSVLRVAFTGDAMDVPEQYRTLLAAYVRREAIGPDKPLALWINTASAAPLARRTAYLRLAAVRNVLLDAGLPPTALSTRILATPAIHTSQTVFVGLKSSTPR
ncbi:hypothetical protein CEK29_16215 [Bordetella genomosp. 5]|uniref:hypothetical protein n=1 Tax=Bordetella genomosp. 5 TaxID=1395608 RepID=UPI000B9E86E0|nr:hypothetical protein [Bordetella genomosp. 5]OZI41468.1 hypothetical protein CEK29_16215 [Bordetella genomosp. 5]